MNKSGLLGFIVLFFLSQALFCQQQAHFSHNMFNHMAVNPAYAGMGKGICATAIARQQWVGFKDQEGTKVNPETFSLTVDAPLPFLRGGLGVGFLQDRLGYEAAHGASLAYSYHLNATNGKWGLGAQLGFLDKRMDFSGFKPGSDGDPILIGGSEESRMFTDFSLGIFYRADDNWWAGVSMAQLTQPNRELGGTAFQLARHGYTSLGFDYQLPALPAYRVSPSLFVKSDFNSFQMDLNTMVIYKEKVWGGLSYRLQDAFIVFLGLAFEQIRIGYAYDITLSPLGANGRSFGSHELMIRYCFELEFDKIQQIQRNVRSL